MSSELAERAPTSLKEKYDDFEYKLGRRIHELAEVLPSHIKPEQFQRVALTAVQLNTKLLAVDQPSLFNAIKKCATDGLLPDGRQAVLVIYNSKQGPIAQYLPMVAGIRKLVQQSGEITRFEQAVVHEYDEFKYELGDAPHIYHKPALGDRGKPTVAYSVAQYRDGTLSREVMTVAEIEKVRDGRAGPWEQWWDEMARKTVAKRHAKVLPMSNDAAEVLARDDSEHFKPPAMTPRPIEHRPRLAERLENLGPAQAAETTPPRRRGRPRKAEEPLQVRDQEHYESLTEAPPPIDDDELPNPLTTPPSADFLAGVKDALRGAATCVNRDINDDEERLAEWRRGYESQKRKP